MIAGPGVFAILGLLGCGEMGDPEGSPPRVEPQVFSKARSWVRTVATDGEQVVWTSYDVSTGRSARAVIDRAPLSGGEAVQLAEERHPPEDLQIWDGYVYWLFKEGPLKRVPLVGGEVEVLIPEVNASCFFVDSTGIYTIEGTDVLVRKLGSAEPRLIVKKSLGDCPVVLDGQVYWNERKAIHTVSAQGGESSKLVEMKLPKGLLVHEGALFTCLSEILTRVDPSTGETSPIRSYCKPDGLVITDDAHWFRGPHFTGWPPAERVRLVEVTSKGVSFLFDGKGVSPPVVVGDQIVWLGRTEDGSSDWDAFRAPLP